MTDYLSTSQDYNLHVFRESDGCHMFHGTLDSTAFGPQFCAPTTTAAGGQFITGDANVLFGTDPGPETIVINAPSVSSGSYIYRTVVC